MLEKGRVRDEVVRVAFPGAVPSSFPFSHTFQPKARPPEQVVVRDVLFKLLK